MTAHALGMALAISDPWSQAAVGRFVPTSSGRTHKVTVFNHFSTNTNGSGFAFVLLTPSFCVNSVHAIVSDSTYPHAGEVIPFRSDDLLETGVLLIRSHSPYQIAQFIPTGAEEVPQAAGRMVAAGANVEYAGPFLNKGGLISMYRSAEHQNVQIYPGADVPTDPGRLSQFKDCIVRIYGSGRHQVSDHVANMDEAQVYVFNDDDKQVDESAETAAVYPFSRGRWNYVDAAGAQVSYTESGVKIGAATACILIQGAPLARYSLKLISHFEVAGHAAQASATPTHTDLEGTARVITAAAETHYDRHATNDNSSWSVMSKALKKEGNTLIKHEIPSAVAAIEALV